MIQMVDDLSASELQRKLEQAEEIVERHSRKRKG